MATVILCYAPDGANLADSVRALLEREPVDIRDNDFCVPAVWDQVVFLFHLTPQLLSQQDFADHASQLVQESIPVVPVTADLGTFRFSSIPESHRVLRQLNTVGLEPNNGDSIIEAVHGYLGFESFATDKSVFISYRRSDGQEVAHQVEDYLWRKRFRVFLDTQQVHGGANVQELIMQQLREMDFMLLIDSPDVAASDWILAEVTEAIRQRIPVCALCLDRNRRHLPLLDDVPAVLWDDVTLEQVALAISRGISARRSLQDRVERTLRKLGDALDAEVTEIATRSLMFSKGGKKVLFEYETSPISLERLYRLFQGFLRNAPCDQGIYISGDSPPLPITAEALEWARRGVPLSVMSISEVYLNIRTLFRGD